LIPRVGSIWPGSDGPEVSLPRVTGRSDPGGERDAWILATLPRALAFAGSLLRDRAAAEDVVHDCYARLLQKATTYDLPSDGTKLLFKAITNACVDRNDRDRKWLRLEFEDGDPLPIADARAWEPHDLASGRELERAVDEALAKLTLAQRGALELKSLGFSLAEIAGALGTTPTNAGVLVHRARARMADWLAPFLEARPDE
jgi:RNA polymerase sigma-70 factor (ECF subfamily)